MCSLMIGILHFFTIWMIWNINCHKNVKEWQNLRVKLPHRLVWRMKSNLPACLQLCLFISRIKPIGYSSHPSARWSHKGGSILVFLGKYFKYYCSISFYNTDEPTSEPKHNAVGINSVSFKQTGPKEFLLVCVDVDDCALVISPESSIVVASWKL